MRYLRKSTKEDNLPVTESEKFSVALAIMNTRYGSQSTTVAPMTEKLGRISDQDELLVATMTSGPNFAWEYGAVYRQVFYALIIS